MTGKHKAQKSNSEQDNNVVELSEEQLDGISGGMALSPASIQA
jgi:hypothetical protein